jgi:hypothetical protein
VTELLRARLCSTSALATSALAHAHGQTELAAHADACAASHFSSLLRDDPAGVAALPAERVAALLASDSLAVAAEADALQALLSWAAATGVPDATKAAPRAHQLAALLPLVRLRLVPRATLFEVRVRAVLRACVRLSRTVSHRCTGCGGGDAAARARCSGAAAPRGVRGRRSRCRCACAAHVAPARRRRMRY